MSIKKNSWLFGNLQAARLGLSNPDLFRDIAYPSPQYTGIWQAHHVDGPETLPESNLFREQTINERRVRKVGVEDISYLKRILARAFDKEPFINWFVRGDTHRGEGIYRLFDTYFRRFSMPYGETYTTTDRRGAALWSPPGKWKLDFLHQLSLLPDIIRMAGVWSLLSRMWGIQKIEENHPKRPHYYLQIIGVDPPFQKKGIGSALLKPVLDICTKRAIPAYLETSIERNLAFFEKHGFRVEKTIKLPANGPTFWLMWREPA